MAQRVADGQVNVTAEAAGHTLGQIIRSNVLTPVNAIMLGLFVLILISGHVRDGLFVGVVLSNAFVGVTQEVRARRELARLEVLVEEDVRVIRDGGPIDVERTAVVVDDLVVLTPGSQAPVDGDVVDGAGLQMDESLLTGESRAVEKKPGDLVLSGSFVSSGTGRVRATKVGPDSYASALAEEARSFETATSQLRVAIDRVIRWLVVVIPIASVLLLLSLLDSEEHWQSALQGTVAAAVAMVPDGLVLLTSVAFVAGAIALARRNALAKQLTTVELLARVDVLCLDKTGTLTTGDITLSAIHPLEGESADDVRVALAAVAASDPAPNPTMHAIAAGVGPAPGWEILGAEPFSSARKWSAVSFRGRGWFYVGAADMLIPAEHPGQAIVVECSSTGQRLLALLHSDEAPDGDTPPLSSRSLAVVALEDEIRPDVRQILDYFADQEVALKIISGDSPDTVAAIAQRSGLQSDLPAVDARTLSEDPMQLGEALEGATVFGRVTPRQKQAMVRGLQDRGHTVAMTGDGVNDVLALKNADLGISMGSGSPATRAVADLVLVDDSFSSLPVVVAEGRKVINNVERVAKLFLTKAAYAVLLTFAVGLAGVPFPFLPRQLTLIGTFSIGIPGFFLALAPDTTIVRPRFLARVLRFSAPAGLIAATATFVAYETARRAGGVELDEARTVATITLLGIGLAILATASRPLRPWKVALVGAMAAAYAGVMAVPWLRDFFELRPFAHPVWIVAAVVAGLASIAIGLIPQATQGFGAAEGRSHDQVAG